MNAYACGFPGVMADFTIILFPCLRSFAFRKRCAEDAESYYTDRNSVALNDLLA
jgi:hypothetical protein